MNPKGLSQNRFSYLALLAPVCEIAHTSSVKRVNLAQSRNCSRKPLFRGKNWAIIACQFPFQFCKCFIKAKKNTHFHWSKKRFDHRKWNRWTKKSTEASLERPPNKKTWYSSIVVTLNIEWMFGARALWSLKFEGPKFKFEPFKKYWKNILM
jgi:hypothetical protein